jgi:hypothetical protein
MVISSLRDEHIGKMADRAIMNAGAPPLGADLHHCRPGVAPLPFDPAMLSPRGTMTAGYGLVPATLGFAFGSSPPTEPPTSSQLAAAR